MADRVSIHEDLILAALRTQLSATVPTGNIETRAVPLTDANLDEMIGKAPFVYVEYGGLQSLRRLEDGTTIATDYRYNIFTAAKSLRSIKEAQRGSYDLLAGIRETLDNAVLVNDDNPLDVKRAGAFRLISEAPLFDSANGGTIYMSVYSVIE